MFPFLLLLLVAIRITSFLGRLNIYVITAGTRKYKSIIKKKKKKNDKILSLVKSKLKSVEVVIFKALIDSNISHDEFVLINNVPKEFDDMKEENKESHEK